MTKRIFFIWLLYCLIFGACQPEGDAQDVIKIETLYQQFHKALKEERYEAAYSYMSPEYRKTHTLGDFATDVNFSGADWLTLHPNHRLTIRGDTATLYPRDQSDRPWSGPEYTLIKLDGQWFFTGGSFWYLD